MRILMFGLARPMLRLLGRDDRGVVGVLLAVLIGGGVLLGMGALVLDVGELYTNRAELQNGADSAALAIARSCAQGNCTSALAAQYATGNASNLTGGAAGIDLVCGSGGLGPCPASSGAMTDCPPAPASGVNYVDVHTSTRTTSGSSLLPPVLARTLLGNSGYQGTTVRSCAQAVWGAPLVSYGLAITISACTWDQATGLGTTFAPAPPYPPNPLPAASLDRVLALHGTSYTLKSFIIPACYGGCETESEDSDPPGNFGWTNDFTGSCQSNITGSTFGGNTGTSVSSPCKTALAAAQANRTVVTVPVYVSVSGYSSSAVYTLKGFASFVITGYHLPGLYASDWLNPANNCRGSSSVCINGYFTRGLIPATGSLGGTYLGASVIKLTG